MSHQTSSSQSIAGCQRLAPDDLKCPLQIVLFFAVWDLVLHVHTTDHASHVHTTGSAADKDGLHQMATPTVSVCCVANPPPRLAHHPPIGPQPDPWASETTA